MDLLKYFFVGMVCIMLGVQIQNAAASEAFQSLEEIQKRVQEFLLAQYVDKSEPPKIRVDPLDPRLRLARCDMGLEVFQPSGTRTMGNTTVGVRCLGPQPWTVYVSAKVQVFAEVLVAARFLPQGTVLAAADLKAEHRDLASLAGNYETVIERLVGKRLRRSLPMSAVIPPQAAVQEPLIKRGARVTILAHQDSMEVSSSGIALSDAALGERLQVRNTSSQKVIEGTVIGAQRIAVGM